MTADVSEVLFSATTLLWLVIAAAAAIILFGSMNRRRQRLTDTLRDYVDRNQEGREASRQSDEGSTDQS